MNKHITMSMAVLLVVGISLVAQSGKPAESRPRPRRIYYMGPGGPTTIRPAILAGNNPRVRVLAPPRLDWEFALSSATLAAAPREILLHDSTTTTYHLWVPATYRHAVAHPLVLFISGKAVPDETLAWWPICRKYGALFATFYNGGNECHPAKRLRLTLDVLDDIRRRMHVDTDRIYLAGFSDGARTACEVAYAYPEFIGGVLAISGASSLRSEAWMRDRVKERLSIALMTGELDPARREMEGVRHAVLRHLEMRVRLWTVPRLGHALPPSSVQEEAFVWLESTRTARNLLGTKYPSARVVEAQVPFPELWAHGLVDEAKVRLKSNLTLESGLLQLEGVTRRWRGSDAAGAARKVLEQYNANAKDPWESVHQRRQQTYLSLEARALDDYLRGPLPARDLLRKATLMNELLGLYEQIEKLGGDTREGQHAGKRLAELRRK
jgi:dienelactone hydrolase